jgi:acyl-CoA thioesterase-1
MRCERFIRCNNLPCGYVSGLLCLVGLLYGLLLFAVPFARADSRNPVIVVFGDSFTAGLGLPHEVAFPAQLEGWLRGQGRTVRVVNDGKSGDTTANAMPRIDNALAERPDIVILELGANDALRGVDPSLTHANLVNIINRIRATGAKVLLTGILAPPNWGKEYQQAFDRIYPDIARTYNVPLYPFFLQGVALQPQLNQPEGLHPNERGVAVIVSLIGPVIVSNFLNEPAPAESRH